MNLVVGTCRWMSARYARLIQSPDWSGNTIRADR